MQYETLESAVESYCENKETANDDIVARLKNALHPADVLEIAGKLNDIVSECECGNIVFDDTSYCDKCGAIFDDSDLDDEDMEEIAKLVAAYESSLPMSTESAPAESVPAQ